MQRKGLGVVAVAVEIIFWAEGKFETSFGSILGRGMGVVLNFFFFFFLTEVLNFFFNKEDTRKFGLLHVLRASCSVDKGPHHVVT